MRTISHKVLKFRAGDIASPNHPANYSRNIKRTDTIQVEQGHAVILDFTAFDIASPDFLKITDGDGSKLLDNTHGSSLPQRVTSRSNVMDIYFTSDSAVEKTGWSANWHVAPQGL